MLTNCQRYGLLSLIALIALWLPFNVFAHGVDEDTRAFLLQNTVKVPFYNFDF